MDIVTDKNPVCVSGHIISSENRLKSEDFDDNRRHNVSETSNDMMVKFINDTSILGRYFELPDFSKSFDSEVPKLDSSLAYIPVYTHLITHDLVPIERPKTPPFIRMMRSRRAMESRNLIKSTLNSRILETNDGDEETLDYSSESSTKCLKSNE